MVCYVRQVPASSFCQFLQNSKKIFHDKSYFKGNIDLSENNFLDENFKDLALHFKLIPKPS